MKAPYVASLLAAGVGAVQVSLSSSPPTDASPSVAKDFLSLAMESWSFLNYTGNSTHPNDFSLNMFKALTSRIGPTPIRIGGDSADLILYDPTQKEAITWGSSQYPPSNLFSKSRVGPSYFDGLSMIDDARFVYQLPLLRNNLSNALMYGQAAFNAMPNGSFQAFEIGNEPEEYGSTIKEYGTWNEAAYVKAWQNWTSHVTQNIKGIPKGPANFWALSLVWPAGWSVANAFEDGLSSDINSIQAVSEHFYQANGTAGISSLRDNLLNHSNTVRIMEKFQPSVNYLKNGTDRKVPLVLGEVGAGMCSAEACPGNIQSTFGAAIWGIDFMLHAMVMGIQRVHFQLLQGAVISPWQPVELEIRGQMEPPQVRGGFYGDVFVADILNQTKGELRVAEVDVTGSGADGSIVAYAIYDGGALSKVVLLDEDLHLTNSTSARPTSSVALSGLGSAKQVRVEHLSGPGGDQWADITWAGQSWSYNSTGLPVTVKNDTTCLTVNSGSVSVPIQATQALLVTLLN